MRTFLRTPYVLALTFSLSACGPLAQMESSDPSIFHTKNLRGSDFGLRQGEVVLTLDDGPGARTLQLAQFLAAQDVPTVFFANYQNNSQDSSSPGLGNRRYRSAAEYICTSGIHHLSSHRDHHNTYGNNSWTDLDAAHAAIREICPEQDYIFYRAPGGAFSPGQAAPLNNAIDQNGERLGPQYIGPVYWDFACDTEANCRSSDWRTLRDNYYRTIVRNGACRGGIILGHDINDATIRALTGVQNLATLGSDSNPAEGLIARLKTAGCRFVALDKDRGRIQSLLGRTLDDGAEPVCRAAPVTELANLGTVFRLQHGPQSAPQQFRASLQVIAGQPAKYPEFDRKFAVSHSASDRSNMAFRLDRTDGTLISGRRYNLAWDANAFVSFTASWNCDRYEGQFRYADGTVESLSIRLGQ